MLEQEQLAETETEGQLLRLILRLLQELPKILMERLPERLLGEAELLMLSQVMRGLTSMKQLIGPQAHLQLTQQHLFLGWQVLYLK